MARAADVGERLDLLLEYDHKMVDELVEVAQEWQELDEGIRVSWSLDWDQVMGVHLRSLDVQYRAATMTPALAARYRDLLRRLKEYLPLIQQLNLYPPPVSLDA